MHYNYITLHTLLLVTFKAKLDHHLRNVRGLFHLWLLIFDWTEIPKVLLKVDSLDQNASHHIYRYYTPLTINFICHFSRPSKSFGICGPRTCKFMRFILDQTFNLCFYSFQVATLGRNKRPFVAMEIEIRTRKTPNSSNDKNDFVVVQNDDRLKPDTTPDGSLKGDRGSIALLMFLYILQGIPLGIGSSIPYLLTSRKVSYSDQALYSFVHWPFSLKLLWAPIVDSVYLRWFGRRKSWLIPTQYLIGLFMLGLSSGIDQLMGETVGDDEASPSVVNVPLLTLTFFMLSFLAATQDVAVDGWALTMLSKWVVCCIPIEFSWMIAGEFWVKCFVLKDSF